MTKLTENIKLIYNHTIHHNAQLKFATHCHNSYEIIFFIKGNANYLIEDRKYILKKYDLIITKPTQYHNVEIVSNDDYERYDILIENCKVIEEMLDGLDKQCEVINCSNMPTIIDNFKKMDEYEKKFAQEDFTELLYLLLVEIMYNIKIYDANPSQDYNLASPLIQKALAYINENLFTIQNVSDVSDYLFVAKNYFFKLFKEQMKVPPKKYINNKRLLQAQRMIANGEKPTGVFDKCGFSNYVSFYKRYVDFFGYPPSQEEKRY